MGSENVEFVLFVLFVQFVQFISFALFAPGNWGAFLKPGPSVPFMRTANIYKPLREDQTSWTPFFFVCGSLARPTDLEQYSYISTE
jgi:hypothetical protein